MSDGFIHSVKVPRLYKVAAKTVRTVKEEGGSVKQLIYEKTHPNLGATYALVLTTLQNGTQLDELIRKTQLLIKEPRLDPWLARILISELLWGKQSLHSNAKPIETILKYKNELCEELKKLSNVHAAQRIKLRVQKPRYVRINTIVKSVDESIQSFIDEGCRLLPKSRDYSSFIASLSELDECSFIQDFHVPELFAFASGTQFHAHLGYKSGAIVLQDKASCLPAYLLSPEPSSTVLDMCAAPGMKSTHLAAIMGNAGTIYSIERDSRRYQTLCEMVQAANATCVKTINADALSVHPNQCPDVEYILVDPSCSGSGMLDRLELEDTNSKCTPGRLRSLQSFQVLLLRHALLSFPKVKRVVYSTCSVYPEENEMVIDEILDNIGEAYKLLPMKKLLGGNWKNFSSTDYKCKDNCLYARPTVDLCNGFFVAIFERNFDVPLPEYKRKKSVNKLKYNNGTTVVNGIAENGKKEQAGKKNRKRKNSKRETEAVTANTKVADAESCPEKVVSNNLQRREEVKVKSLNQSKVRQQVEAQCVTIGDEEPIKKKKRKRSEPEEWQVAQKVEVLDTLTIDGQKTKKKKKKKKRPQPEESEVAQKAEIFDTVTIDEQKSEKKKKKRKERDESEVTELVEILDTLTVDEQKPKKKKKKRSEPEESQVAQEVESLDTLTVVEQKIKKKHKKSEPEKTEVTQTVQVVDTLTLDEQKTKKKKKKRPESEELEVEEIIELLDTSTLEEQKIKKKKKKRSEPEESRVAQEVEVFDISTVDEEKMKKKKKEKKNGHITDV